ncbi:LLM class flavin-dependent oxidoreductase [Actinacidiphila paucisporea]|uniref:Luciferase-like monooxygenase n=1 Tax=Actinacidiphila paucisporea TaxID=310782 RepID=A0A1M7P4Q7_9ACTN|nr:LLM class flavin-dependent oxidoreductase [Actinacidiphila paucisporea]SHN11611.1 Luciferase-like monooxygenase [Actinacidiphila paucisporea]
MTAGPAPGAVRQLHLAVQLLGAGGEAGPRPDFDTCAALAKAAERGLFDFLLLTGGARTGGVRPAASAAYDTGTSADGWAGPERWGPEPVTVLHALAAVTSRIGLAVAVPAGAGGEPYDLARRIAALDRVSGGRAGGPPGRYGEAAGPQGRPVTLDFGGKGEVLITGPGGLASGVRRGARRMRVLSRFELAAGAAATAAAARDLADRLHAQVQSAATDGFVLHPDPAAAGRGLDAFVDRVVPLLQQHGSLRTAYTGTTLRDHLGLPRS